MRCDNAFSMRLGSFSVLTSNAHMSAMWMDVCVIHLNVIAGVGGGEERRVVI